VRALFCRLLSEHCKVDFMGIAEWFLGVHFSWRVTSSSVSVHMNQSGFTNNLVESFSLKSRNETPTATPYRSGVPIDSIAPSTDADDSPFKVSLEASVGCCLPHAQPHCGPLLQLGSSVADGTLLPLFKFRSMNGGIVFKNAGPLVWLGDRQERTIDVEHVAGKINPADIFTKEMGNGAHFHRLRDSFMS